ncbi:hypothetical protein LINPERPRIM_LOCUS43173 [Linum perenne]
MRKPEACLRSSSRM